MIIENDKPIRVIGYPESSLTDGAVQWFSLESKNEIEIITPEVFLDLPNKSDYQYFVGFSLDMDLRKKVCNIIDGLELDCITYIHDSCVVFDNAKVGKGVFISSFTSVLYYANIADHCWIEPYCLVAHHVQVGKGCVVHIGSLIAGRTVIGDYCTLGMKSSTINTINITDYVTIGAFSNVTKDITRPGRYIGSIARYVGD